MSFEIGVESRAAYARGTRRAVAGYPGLGATGAFATILNRATIASPAIATAPWMQGLPGPGDSKDNTRIAYAKRDHDLAMPPRNDVTAYNNLKSQAVGSATKVGKAWYNAALADVNRARAAAAPPPPPPPPKPVVPVPTPPSVVYVNTPKIPIVQQATDMGLKVQQTADGKVVGVNSDGAVVTKPLPVPTSAVTDKTIVPADAVQANAPPPPRTHAPSSGIFSILDKLTQQQPSVPTVTSSDSFIPSSGAPAPTAPTTVTPSFVSADMTGGFGSTLGVLFQNPVMLIGAAAGLYFLFASSSAGRKR